MPDSTIRVQAECSSEAALLYGLCTELEQVLLATDQSIAGDFTASSQAHVSTAAVCAYLGNAILPEWIAKDSRVVSTKHNYQVNVTAEWLGWEKWSK